MPRCVLDLGLRPNKRAKAQADRRQKRSEEQIKVQTANQIEAAQQLQCFLPPSSSPFTKTLGLQEIGRIFDEETKRMWDIDLRQRGLEDGIETRDKLSQLHHELFRVSQCKILDRYWRKIGQKNSQRGDAREIARMDLRMEIYKRCKEWFESKNSTTYLNSPTEMGSAQLQLRGSFVSSPDTLFPGYYEELGCSQLQFGRTSVRPLDTINLNNDDRMNCARCCAQSQLERAFETLPDTVDPRYYQEVGSTQLQLGKPSVRPLVTGCLSSDEGVSCAPSQLRRTFGRPSDTNNSDAPVPSTTAHCPHCPFPTPTHRITGQGQNQYPYVGQDTTFSSDCEQIFGPRSSSYQYLSAPYSSDYALQ